MKSQDVFSKIICLDFKDASLKDFNDFLKEHTDFQKVTIEYLEQLIVKNSTSNDVLEKTARVYLYGSFILATTNQHNDILLNPSYTLLDELDNIPVLNENHCKELIDKIMTQIIRQSKIDLTEIDTISLYGFARTNLNFPTYKIPCVFENVVGFNVGNHNLKLFDMLSARLYKPLHNLIRKKYQQNNIINDLVVENLYYIGETLFAIKATYLHSNESFYRYSDNYLNLLQTISPISLDVSNENLNMDEILDKISVSGMDSLTETELDFLNNNNF
ncbi:hypothetical protein FSS13T_05520 [Flavobacterium saliperosum S13]|uniref:Uncharacterized protein n=2 Tax=Flavobacterium saliperosum TaxID=329186 RepID=A0A1G4V8E1_9FLAO|nr:hypothetical protein [Flavobacterium saliperosum]ESU28061.1 hypothetical protein FSS13T_05520 [Flavobacterium saliperosum S13]SCX02879.1 hypothetical protein SAMN02927925_00579 [Flavobacterium saliperosum]